MKKSSKIIIALLIIILIAILGVGGYFIYNLNNSIEQTNKAITDLKNEKSADKAMIENMIKENINTKTDIKTTNEANTVLTETEEKKLGDELFKKLENLLYANLVLDEDVEIQNDGFVAITKKLKDEIYTVLTNNAINELETKCSYKEKNGKYYYNFNQIDPGSMFGHTDAGRKELVVSSISEDKIVFTVNCYNLVDGSGVEERIDYTYKNAFTIVKSNGNWIIDSIEGKRS